jgi:hypothetical protein
MTAFDVVHDRLDVAVGMLSKAHTAYRKYLKTKPLHQIYRVGDDPKGVALIDAEHSALLKVIAAFHYAEQVSASDYRNESSLAFEKRERRKSCYTLRN